MRTPAAKWNNYFIFAKIFTLKFQIMRWITTDPLLNPGLFLSNGDLMYFRGVEDFQEISEFLFSESDTSGSMALDGAV